MVSEKTVVLLTGPTAVGKTGLSIELALQHGSIEIINADSLLIYRGMDIGTAKPSLAERRGIPHHLIDIRDPDQPFTAGEFVRAATAAIDAIHLRGKRALIVGGTGFYLKSLLFGVWEAPQANPVFRAELENLSNDALWHELNTVDSTSAQRIGLSDRYRLIRALEIFRTSGKTPTELQNSHPKAPDPRFKLWIIDRSSDKLNLNLNLNAELHQRIEKRTAQMIQDGIIQEYQTLSAAFPKARPLGAVGYAQVRNYLEGIAPSGRKMKEGMEGLSDEIQLATRQLVKSQRTWFKGLCQKVPSGKWFHMDQDRNLVVDEFNSVYSKDCE